MSVSVGVIDYGMGNLHSVAKALVKQGGRVTVSSSIADLAKSKLLVLPGVGAFGAAMLTLREKGLDRFVRNWISEGKPYLGICLGFQLLFESSEESPGVVGLGVLPGRVVKFQKKDLDKKAPQIPHMGWNTAEPAGKKRSGYLRGITASDRFYFVHTYFPEPDNKEDIETMTSYGKKFCSSVSRGALFASQFHPEKSGDVGLRLLKNVLAAA